jgi:hypothetical protein
MRGKNFVNFKAKKTVMIDLLPDLPANVIGFKATGEVTREDFEKVVFPGIKKYTGTSRKLNFIFFVDTPLRNFSAGAWIRDIWLGVKKFAAWNKVAIVSDVEKIRNFTDSVSYILPGEYKGFLSSQLNDAVRWAATEEQNPADAGAPDYIKELLPAQVKGLSTETSATVMADRDEDARYIFERAIERLLDVNNWTDHCRPMAAGFQLADETGEPLQGSATEGDFIQIDLPGPGPREGKGYDWVQIEKIAASSVAAANLPETDIPETVIPEKGSIFLIQARPSRDPQIKGSTRTAHFLEDSATSTFVIEKNGKKVTATVFGRNEVPNTDEAEGIDKLRNGLVGSVGAIGLSKGQWKDLVAGLLEKK